MTFSTLYFETDEGDGFGEPGFSKKRCPVPQLTIGLLTRQDGSRIAADPYPTTSARHSRPSTTAAGVCTNLSQLG